jgi:lysophospholipase L1-like esterase
MRTSLRTPAVALLLVACGGGSNPVSAPTPPIRNTTFLAFLDENRNGLLDGSEAIRIPGVEISFGSASGRTTAPTGTVSLDVAQSAQTLSVSPGSLPPYHRAPDPSVQAPPAAGTFHVPITLPLGMGVAPGVFLAFGDSITNGQAGVGDGQGYTGELEKRLTAHFGKARVINDGVDSSSSERGDARIGDSLAGGRPAFTLVLYGTNDWADPRCGQTPCFTIDRLRSMVQKVKAQGGFPFVGTLLMTNVGGDFRASPQRNSWIAAQNDNIRRMALEEDVVLVDLHAAFERSPLPYSDLFADYIHPSAQGYRLIAETWFEAITKRR